MSWSPELSELIRTLEMQYLELKIYKMDTSKAYMQLLEPNFWLKKEPVYFDIFQIVRDSKDRVFTWGFGGYGRLGHQQPKDEHVPRLVSFFKGKSESKRVVFLYCLLLLLLSIFFYHDGYYSFCSKHFIRNQRSITAFQNHCQSLWRRANARNVSL